MFCKAIFIIGESYIFPVTFTPRSLCSADSPWKFYLLFLSFGCTILEKIRIFSEILNVYSKTKIKFAGKKDLLLLKEKKTAAQFSFNSDLLIQISSRANKEISCPKLHISPAEKVEYSELERCWCSPYYRNLGTRNCSSICL